MKHKTIILSSFLLSLLGCGIGNSGNPNTGVTSSPSSKPTDISISPSNSPTSLVATPSPSSTGLSNREKYSYDISCKDIDSEPIPKLNKPYDLAVSRDGTKLYVLNKRNPVCCSPDIVNLIDRQFIYKISVADKKISVIKTQEGYPDSCTLSNEIEIDKDDNIYVSSLTNKDVKFDTTYFKPSRPIDEMIAIISEHRIIKISNDNKSEVYGDIKFPVPDVISPIAPPISTDLSYMYVSKKDNSIYFVLSSGGVEYHHEAINKLKSYDQLDKLYETNGFGSYINSFTIENSILNFGFGYYDLNSENKVYKPSFYMPTPKENTSSFSPKRIKINSKGETILIYDSQNRIDKIIPNVGVVHIAGSGVAGYKDGTGSEAEFNNPTGLDIDAQDNIYVADSGNNAIRKISPIGVVTTVYKESN